MSKHRFGLGMAAVLRWAATAQANDLTVRAFNAARYTESSLLTFWVDARDENGPIEGLQTAAWGLTWGERPVETVATAAPYRSKDLVTSVLVLLPATPNFTGRDDTPEDKERMRAPLQYLLEGLETLKASIAPKDHLSVGCYDADKADPFKLSGAIKDSDKVQMPDVARVERDCTFARGGGNDLPRLQTLMMGAIKSWMSKAQVKGAKRHIVILVADGSSKERVGADWFKQLPALGDPEAWMELYVVGLEDGHDPDNLDSLAKGGLYLPAAERQNLADQLGALGTWVKGDGIYQVDCQVESRLGGQGIELGVKAGRGGRDLVSAPFPVGTLKAGTAWLQIVLLVAAGLVALVFVVLLVRLIVRSAAARRRRREEEARNQPQVYDGPSRGRLIVREGPAANEVYPLIEDLSYVGRSPDNHVSIPDPTVSKRHASITIRDRTYVIEDMQSAAGLLVNGQRVVKAHLKDGDSIRMGQTEMQFRI
jgi:hypothetical protein